MVRNLISLNVKPLELFKANTFNNNNKKNLNGSKMSSSSCYMDNVGWTTFILSFYIHCFFPSPLK